MAIRSLATVLEMAACIVGEKARGVDNVGWSASTSTRTYRRDPGACKCARTIGTTSQHTCWVERPGPASQGLSTLRGGYCHDSFLELSPI